jgi:cytochrome c oxidase assembly protein subunit 15
MSERFGHRLAVITAGATWFLLIAGALVTSTGSGLSVPDWPLSYGQWMPPMIGGVLFEHGHRMVAGCVALLTIFLAFTFSHTESRPWVRVLSFGAVGLVLLQATLGGLTVLLRLPPAISVSHAMLGQTFFCLVTILACVTSPAWAPGVPGSRPGDRGLFNFSVFISLLFFVQLFLGASVRHLHGGLSIPDFPTVYGGFLPPVWNPQIAFHFAHRMTAYLLCVLVLVMAFKILSRERTDRIRIFLVVLWIGFIAIQIQLGALTIWLRRPVVVTAGHLAVGALCLVVSVVLSFRLGWVALPSQRPIRVDRK